MSQMSQEGNVISGEGNTKIPRNRSRNWCFTWNNYTENDKIELKRLLNSYEYVFQEEVGENGTPHLQGCFQNKNAIEFEKVKKILPKCHIEKCKSWDASKRYCSKLDTRVGTCYSNIKGFKPMKDPMDGLIWKNWQLEIKELIKHDPDNRKIYWYWEEVGNTGKTTFAKHLVMIHNAVYVSGKATDVKFAISEMVVKPEIVIWDIPRCMKDYISYQSIEEVKNGIFFSSKFESKQCVFDSPHIIIFANQEPEEAKLSADRWIIKNIGIENTIA